MIDLALATMVYSSKSNSNDQIPNSNFGVWIFRIGDWSETMRACEICGKKSQIQKSGAHNYGGGWAYRASKTRFVSEPNLHANKVTYQGVRRTMRLCTKCLRRVKEDMAKIVKKEYKKAPEVSAPTAA